MPVLRLCHDFRLFMVMVSQKPLVNPLNTSNLYITQINTRNGGVLSQNKQSARRSSVGTCATHGIGTTSHATPVSIRQNMTSLLKSKSINKDNKQMRWWVRCCCLDHSLKQSTRRAGWWSVIINNKCYSKPEMATAQPFYDPKCSHHSPCSVLSGQQPGSQWLES